jgi:anti-anti-sigma factor
MLGLIVNIRQQIKSGGGRLIVCGMSPRLTEIFHNCSMERLFTIVKTRPDALKNLSK